MRTKVKIVLLFCVLLCMFFAGCGNAEQGHVCKFDKTVIEPTCFEKGFTTYLCSCGNSYISDYTEQLEHSYKKTTVSATCTTDGYDNFTCVCGKSYTENAVDALGHLFLTYIPNNDATFVTDGTKTAVCERENCSASNTVNDAGTKKQSLIELKGFEYQNQTYKKKLSSAQQSVAFSDFVSVVGIATYTVFYDEALTKEVGVDYAALDYGSNVFYLVERIEQNLKTYKLDFYRKHVYTVELISYDNVKFDSYSVDEGDTLSAPTDYPERNGYEFEGWNCDFSQTVLEDKSIRAVWSLVNYTVTFRVGEYAKDFNGIVTYNIESGTADFIAPTKNGYDFDCWLIDGQKVSKIEKGDFGDKIVTAQWKAIFNVKNGKITGLAEYGKTCKVLTIPATVDGICVTGIEQMSFYANKIVKEISFEENANFATIGSRTFYNCTNLNKVQLPENLTEIGDYLFYGCENLTLINVEDLTALKSIASYAFANCKNLTSLTLPSSLESVGTYAFWGCGNLNKIVMPSSLLSLGRYAFKSCTALTSIKFLGTTEKWENLGYSDWTLIPATYVECADGKFEI